MGAIRRLVCTHQLLADRLREYRRTLRKAPFCVGHCEWARNAGLASLDSGGRGSLAWVLPLTSSMKPLLDSCAVLCYNQSYGGNHTPGWAKAIHLVPVSAGDEMTRKGGGIRDLADR